MPTSRVPPPLLSALVEQAEVGFAVLDRELRFVGLNEALAQMNGVAVAAHIGRTLEEVVPAIAAEARRPFESVFADEEPIRDLEIRSTTPAGEGVWLESVYPLRNGNGEVEAIGVVVVDIADRARTSEHLQRLSTRLAQAGTAQEIARVMAEDCAVAVGMERSAVSLVADRDRDDGEVRYVELAASVGYSEQALENFRRVPLDAPFPGSSSLRDGRARWYSTSEELEREFPDLAPVYRAAGNVAGAVIPLMISGRPLGYLALAHPEPRPFAAAERERALAIADQAAQALGRAFLHEREHQLAHTLQESLMPEAVHKHPGVEVACGYLPAGTVARVGGDWFDVIDLPGDEVLLIVGDVAGHGVQAAAEMAELSAVLRSQALAGAEPAAGLDFLRRYSADRPHFPFATVCCCRLSPASGELRFARAGHPPPLLAGPDGVRYLDGGLGAAIGIEADPAGEAEECTVRLAPGETVLLYTDGLIEQGRPGYDEGLTRLAERVAPRAAKPSQLVDGIEEELGREELEDDVAVLAFSLS